MFESLETGVGLDVVLTLQEVRSPLVDAVVHFLDWANYDLFYLLLLTFIYWAVNKRLGLRTYFVLLVAILTNALLKNAFARPRPPMVDDAVTPLFEAAGYGIPSGHTMVPLIVFGYLALQSQRRWAVALALSYAALQAIGRIYAGVHFPQDAVGGVVFGLIVLTCVYLLDDHAARVWQALPLPLQSALAVLVLVGGWWLARPDEVLLTLVGLLGGGLLAQVIEARTINFAAAQAWRERLLVYGVGIVLSFVTLVGLDVLFEIIGNPAGVLRVVRYAAVSVVALAVVPALGVRLGWLERTASPADDPAHAPA